jgi:hypothetical protein
MVFKHSYFNNTDAITAEATTRADAITAETLARTTADGLQNTAISNNTDAISAEALWLRTTCRWCSKHSYFQ